MTPRVARVRLESLTCSRSLLEVRLVRPAGPARHGPDDILPMPHAQGDAAAARKRVLPARRRLAIASGFELQNDLGIGAGHESKHRAVLNFGVARFVPVERLRQESKLLGFLLPVA